MFANASRRSRAHVDVPLILMVFAMCFFGIYAVCVATYSINSTATNLLEHILESSSTLRQCFFVLVLAPLVMTLIILCPYHLIRRFTRAMYIGTTVLVLVVWVFNRAEGVKAWLDIIWDMTIQPSEFIKLAMILMLAQRLSQSEHPMSTFHDFLGIFAMVAVPCAIVLFSGETGSAIVVVFAFACMLLFAVLMQAAGTVVGPGQTAAWGSFGTMLLREDAGGYVLVAVVSFAAAATITALCFRLRNRENRRKDGANKHARHEQEEKSQ